MTTLAGRYELAEVIGNGGMSEVFAAQDTLLGRTVAVKMLRQEMARDVSFRERFRKEAQNSGRLNHPNIVAVYDTGEDTIDGIAIPYIVMERVFGRTLRDIVREDGPLAPDAAAELLEPVCQALQSSHEAGIIHRDIKPANIMITNTGQVKVMDFGIARALDDSTSAMTQTSAVIGTAQYLSPEQARGNAADARSDVYALGCVLYEAVTGRTPFQGETPFAVAYQHVQEEPTPPSHHISAPLSNTEKINIDAVVLTAMAKHPADRYQAAFEMGDDLKRLASGNITNAAAVHVDETPPPPPQKQEDQASSGTTTLAVLLSLALLGTVGYFAWDFFQNDGTATSASNSAPDSPDAKTKQTSNMVEIPDVKDREKDEVIADLRKLGLKVTTKESPSPSIEEGRAISISPAAGSKVQKDSSVTVTISTGEETTEVPDLSGMNTQEASEALREVGLKLNQNVSRTYSDSAPRGTVIKQSPEAGEESAKGSQVTITISRGEEKVTVPSVSGMGWTDAKQALEEAGLEATKVATDSTKPEDQVLSASQEGSEVPKGTEITVEVSNNMLMQMPDLVRSTTESAESKLKAEGWSGSLQSGKPVGTGALIDEGLIAVTSPDSGETIRKDADITVRYWKFDLDKLVP
ncbi:Stk1 family PASTA domain-containing Ser/Thr kinase [Corynebacterium incognita]|uniref:non-specific serine/threonine protein kinase n=1 Tax=Corynebacterium incognita TaxID=2754725 RepID=A0A7G7CM27_9CORY|nr:Stk1 family PASTA domain-containing Ser/Thr kinase [Corynebacterium incognita]QNE88643.1 Stk1 family PASTA domain-containing Ser/Thr kinase [Corynebacterium incognita]